MLKLIMIAFILCIIISSTLSDSRNVLSVHQHDNEQEQEVAEAVNRNRQHHLIDQLRLLNKHENRLNKRSDIDSRLMELQAKIDLVKAFQSLPAGHGKFDFDKIGKRFLDPMKFTEQND